MGFLSLHFFDLMAHKDPEGINFLEQAGIEIEQIENIEDGEK